MTENNNVEKIDGLLNEFTEQRDHLKQMINEVEKIKDKIDQLLPDSKEDNSDFRNYMKGSRYISLFEERVKSITEFFRIILEMRKEISKTLKDEVELRRKAEQNFSDDLSNLLDISTMAERVEQYNKKKEKLKEKHQ